MEAKNEWTNCRCANRCIYKLTGSLPLSKEGCALHSVHSDSQGPPPLVSWETRTLCRMIMHDKHKDSGLASPSISLLISSILPLLPPSPSLLLFPLHRLQGVLQSRRLGLCQLHLREEQLKSIFKLFMWEEPPSVSLCTASGSWTLGSHCMPACP